MVSPWKPSLSVPEVSRLRKSSNVGPDEETYCSDRRRSLDTRQPCANPSPVTTPGTKDIGVDENRTPTSMVTMLGGELAAWCRWLQRLQGKVEGSRCEVTGSTSARTCDSQFKRSRLTLFLEDKPESEVSTRST